MEDDDAPPQVSAVTSTAETAPRFSLLRRPKRRPAEDSSEPSQHDVVSDSLKRFRISIQPGEIRLRHDLEEPAFLAMARQHNIAHVVTGHSPLHIQVQIGRLFPAAGAHAAAAAATTTTSSSDPLVPGHFILHVPRYYPHEPPLVHASTPWPAPWSSFIDPTSGRFAHPYLLPSWNATQSFGSCVHSLVLACQQIISGPPLLPQQMPPQTQHGGAPVVPASGLVSPPSVAAAEGQSTAADLRVPSRSGGGAEFGLGMTGSSWRSGKLSLASLHSASELSNSALAAAQTQPVRVESSVGYEEHASGPPQDWVDPRLRVASPVGGGVVLGLSSLDSSGSDRPMGDSHERTTTVPAGLGEGGGSFSASEGVEYVGGSFYDEPDERDIRRRLTAARGFSGDEFGHSTATGRRSFEGAVHHVLPNVASFDSELQLLPVEDIDEMANSDTEDDGGAEGGFSSRQIRSGNEPCLMPPPGLLW